MFRVKVTVSPDDEKVMDLNKLDNNRRMSMLSALKSAMGNRRDMLDTEDVSVLFPLPLSPFPVLLSSLVHMLIFFLFRSKRRKKRMMIGTSLVKILVTLIYLLFCVDNRDCPFCLFPFSLTVNTPYRMYMRSKASLCKN